MKNKVTEDVVRELDVAREVLDELQADQYRIRAANTAQRQRARNMRALAAQLRAEARRIEQTRRQTALARGRNRPG